MTEDRRGAPNDVALVREVAGGSFDALATLYDRHAAAVFAVATRLTSDRGVAEEVVQDTFLALWDRADAYDVNAGTLADVARTRSLAIGRSTASGRRAVVRSLVALSGGDDIDGVDRAPRSTARRRRASWSPGSVPVMGPEAA